MDLLNRIEGAGIIGAGGAGFPTHVKLASKAEYIILNSAECEPLLEKDIELMKLYPQKIIRGFEIARKLIGADKALIAIKNIHEGVIDKTRREINSLGLKDDIQVKEVKDIYPVGDETILVYELTGRIVPELGIPIEVGCVVINVETALNIYNASLGKVVTEKYITIAGDISNRLTIKVPIGTPIMEVLELTGIENWENYRVINGGLMMGPVLEEIDGYISKKTSGFIILKKNHNLIRRKSMTLEGAKKINRSVCEQCRMCTDMCPRYLLGHDIEPHKIMRGLNYSLSDLRLLETAQLCCECNLCELFACHPGLYPRISNIYYKEKLSEKNKSYNTKKRIYKASSVREYRMVPSKKLIRRLGLDKFNESAPFVDIELEPDLVHISRRQHIGAAVNPIVKVGDMVKKGQEIGKVENGNLGANIHASIEGTITESHKDFIAIRRK